jgi:imidazolonepropionase-like amidohydrolase
MRLRVSLRPVHGEPCVRDIVDGRWADPSGTPDDEIGDPAWALPGLVDGHAHLATGSMGFDPGSPDGAVKRMRQAVDAGVLLVFDKGWSDLTTIETMDRIPPSQRPEIEAAGRVLSVEGGYIANFTTSVPPGEIAAYVDEAAAEGRGWVKLIGDWPRKGVGPVANFDERELETAVSVAVAGGARVAIHTMAREVPAMAVRAGVHSIEHGLFLEEGDLAALGARGGMWVPTVNRMEAVVRQLGEASSGGRLITEGLANVARLLPLATEAGVMLLAGTDRAMETHEVVREALRLHEMGLGVVDTIAAVSKGGFAAASRDTGFAPGSPADAVLFPANPLDDPGVLAFPSHVIRLGRVVA